MNAKDDFSLAFGMDIREGRERLGLTQGQLAKVVGCSTVHISIIERGKQKPSQKMAFLLCSALKLVPVDSLVKMAVACGTIEVPTEYFSMVQLRRMALNVIDDMREEIKT